MHLDRRAFVWSGLAFCSFGSLGHAAPEPGPDRIAAEPEAVKTFKENLDKFQLSLNHHGPSDKPFYTLHLYAGEPKQPRQPFFPTAGLTKEQTFEIVKQLQDDGFFRIARDVTKTKGTDLASQSPCYVLTVQAGDHLVLREELGFDMAMMSRLDALRKHLHGEAATSMDFLLGRIRFLRGAWAKGHPKEPTIETWIELLDSDDGKLRVTASKELLRRGARVLPALEQAGAKAIATEGTVSAKRRDVVYSLLKGLPIHPPKAATNFRLDSFGLHVEVGTRQTDLKRMATKYGFEVPKFFTAENSPACYVTLQPGKTLDKVLTEILTTEPQVTSANLNYVER